MIHRYITIILCTFAIMLTAMTCDDEFPSVRFAVTNKSEQDIFVAIQYLDADNTTDGIWILDCDNVPNEFWTIGTNMSITASYFYKGSHGDLFMTFYAFYDLTFNDLKNIEDYPYIDKIKLSYEELEARNFELVYSEDGFEK